MGRAGPGVRRETTWKGRSGEEAGGAGAARWLPSARLWGLGGGRNGRGHKTPLHGSMFLGFCMLGSYVGKGSPNTQVECLHVRLVILCFWYGCARKLDRW